MTLNAPAPAPAPAPAINPTQAAQDKSRATFLNHLQRTNDAQEALRLTLSSSTEMTSICGESARYLARVVPLMNNIMSGRFSLGPQHFNHSDVYVSTTSKFMSKYTEFVGMSEKYTLTRLGAIANDSASPDCVFAQKQLVARLNQAIAERLSCFQRNYKVSRNDQQIAEVADTLVAIKDKPLYVAQALYNLTQGNTELVIENAHLYLLDALKTVAHNSDPDVRRFMVENAPFLLGNTLFYPAIQGLECALISDSDSDVRNAALKSFEILILRADSLYHEKSVNTLIKALESDSAYVRGESVRCLFTFISRNLWQTELARLILTSSESLVRDSDAYVRKTFLEGYSDLAKLPGRLSQDLKIVSVLLNDALKDTNSSVRVTAVKGMGALQSSKSRQAIESELFKTLNDSASEVRGAAATVLLSGSDEAFDKVLTALGVDSDPTVKIGILDQIQAKQSLTDVQNKAALSAMVELFGDKTEDVTVRTKVFEVAFKLGANASQIIQTLLSEGLQDCSVSVRTAAINALAQQGKTNEQIIKLCDIANSNVRVEERVAAIKALDSVKQHSAVAETLQKLYKEAVSDIQGADEDQQMLAISSMEIGNPAARVLQDTIFIQSGAHIQTAMAIKAAITPMVDIAESSQTSARELGSSKVQKQRSSSFARRRRAQSLELVVEPASGSANPASTTDKQSKLTRTSSFGRALNAMRRASSSLR